MTEQQKQWIDSATHLQLLEKWRFSPSGDPLFEGECGNYYQKVMQQKRDADPAQAVSNSKILGWGTHSPLK